MNLGFFAWTLKFSWVLKLLLSVAEPGAPWAETYAVTAQAIADAADSPMAAAVLVSVAKFESNLNPGALGDCKPGKPRTLENCQSLGLFQISKAHASAMHLLIPSTAAVEAMRLVRASRRICGDGENALSWYATGGPVCVPNLPESRHRMLLASRLARTPLEDSP